MRLINRLVVFAAAVMLFGSTAAAQAPRLLEFGIDAQVTFGLDDPNITVVSLPAGNFRVGFDMAGPISLEPSFALTSVSGGGSTVTVWNAGLGMLWHFREMRSGPYVRPFFELMGVSGGGDSDTQFAAGAGLGYKIPVADGRVAWRFEANYAHAFDTGDSGSSNQIGLRAGLSFFTR